MGGPVRRFLLLLPVLPLAACAGGVECGDTGMTELLEVTLDHEERAGVYSVVLDMGGEQLSCSYQWPYAGDFLPCSGAGSAEVTGDFVVVLSGSIAADAPVLTVSRDGEELYNETLLPVYEEEADDIRCDPNLTVAELTVSF